ncbi:Dot/Icm system substrate protein LidA [Legionella birminghamensis]|uniref:Dot/Icm system substrate protein LidA n=1 Tax=Legionella birminghamensis TaxID=28083 RepID=A0A378I7L8_9GAMM|nr:hypothetical protein [Legionella birminghamensis]KTC73737.1 Dot/Icm system substrate protein LidA [Legionella birminghamensis]STX30766.1 Dot/Icm system substrate protein LidA [Legionella birminghamensis]
MPSQHNSVSQWLMSFDNLPQEKKANSVPGSDVKKVLGLFGLKNAKDVHEFLESPEGREAKVRVYKEIAQHQAMIDAIHAKAQMDRLRSQRALAYLLMLLFAKRARAKKEYNAEIDRQIKQDLARNKVTQDTIKLEMPPFGLEWELLLEAYEISERIIHAALKQSLRDAQEIEKELERIDAKQQELTQKYDTLKELLNEHEAHLEPVYERSNPEEQTQFILQRLEQLKAAQTAAPKISPEQKQADKIHRQHLHNLLAALNNEKRMYNIFGMKVDNLKEAAFFVPIHYHLIMKDEHVYLFEHENELTDLPPQTPHLLDKAQKLDLQHKGMLGMQQLFHMKRAHEMNRLEQRRNAAETRRIEVLEDVAKFSKTLIDIDEARLHAMERVAVNANPSLGNRAPTPRPQPAFQKDIESSYTHMLRLMRDKPTPAAIESLKATVRAAQIQSAPLDRALNSLSPNSRMPEETRKLLQQGIGLFGGRIVPQPGHTAVRPQPDYSASRR